MKSSFKPLRLFVGAFLLVLVAACTSVEWSGEIGAGAFVQPMHAGLVASGFFVQNDRWPSIQNELVLFSREANMALDTNVFADLSFVPQEHGTALMIVTFNPPLHGAGTNTVSIGTHKRVAEPATQGAIQ